MSPDTRTKRVLCAAVLLSALIFVPSAAAFKVTPDTPTNGQIIVVRTSSPVTYVHFKLTFYLDTCFINPQVEPYHVELFQLRFVPMKGRGRSWSDSWRGLLSGPSTAKFKAIEVFDSGDTPARLSGYAMIYRDDVTN